MSTSPIPSPLPPHSHGSSSTQARSALASSVPQPSGCPVAPPTFGTTSAHTTVTTTRSLLCPPAVCRARVACLVRSPRSLSSRMELVFSSVSIWKAFFFLALKSLVFVSFLLCFFAPKFILLIFGDIFFPSDQNKSAAAIHCIISPNDLCPARMGSKGTDLTAEGLAV